MRIIAIACIVALLGCYGTTRAGKQTAYVVDGLGLVLGSAMIAGGVSSSNSEDEVRAGSGVLVVAAGVVIACAAAIGLVLNVSEPDAAQR